MAPLDLPFALILLPIFLASPIAGASQLEARGSESGTWSSAYWVSQQDLTAASQAQCPSYAPVSCSSIQEPDYCCASGNYCAYASNNQVGCCPWGQTCTGNIGSGGVATQPMTTWSTWVSPTTTYVQPSTVYVTQNQLTTTTVVYAAGQQTEQVTTEQVLQTVVNSGQYCSTLYAHGDNLPTTEAGTCGTILIENVGVRSAFSVSRAVLAGAFLLALGSLLLQLRAVL